MSVPRQGVEPCFAQDKEMHARKMGKSRTRARIGKSVACRRDRRGRMPSLHEAGHGLTKHLGSCCSIERLSVVGVPRGGLAPPLILMLQPIALFIGLYGAKTRRASRRTAQIFKIRQLQSEKDVRPCVFRCERLHGCCKSQPTGGLPTASDADKHLRWWVS